MFFSFNEFDEVRAPARRASPYARLVGRPPVPVSAGPHRLPGGLSFEEFGQAAEQLGFAIRPEKRGGVPRDRRRQERHHRSGRVLSRFIMKRQAPVEVDLEGVDTSSVFEHIRPPLARARGACERARERRAPRRSRGSGVLYGGARKLARDAARLLSRSSKRTRRPVGPDARRMHGLAMARCTSCSRRTQARGSAHVGGRGRGWAAASRSSRCELRAAKPQPRDALDGGRALPRRPPAARAAITRGWPASVCTAVWQRTRTTATPPDQVTRKKGLERPKLTPTTIKGYDAGCVRSPRSAAARLTTT